MKKNTKATVVKSDFKKSVPPPKLNIKISTGDAGFGVDVGYVDRKDFIND